MPRFECDDDCDDQLPQSKHLLNCSTLVFFGFCVTYNKPNHMLLYEDYTKFYNTPLAIHYINDDQCVIALQDSVHSTDLTHIMEVDKIFDESEKEWAALDWDSLIEQIPLLAEVRNEYPRWAVWASPIHYQ